MKRRFIALLLIMAAVFAFFCSGALAAERDSISVNGHARAEVSPDMATLYGNLEKRAAVAETAREELAKEMESLNLDAKMENVGKLMDEFNNIAQNTENGKKVMEDKAFEEQLMKELGIEEMFGGRASEFDEDDDIDLDKAIGIEEEVAPVEDNVHPIE